MEPSNIPKINPPKQTDIRKTSGTFIKRNTWVIIVGIAVVLVGLGIWVISNKIKELKYAASKKITISNIDTENKTILYQTDSIFTVAYTKDIQTGILNLKANTTSYKIDSTTNQLFIANTMAFDNKYQFDSRRDGSAIIMDFSSKNNKEKKVLDNDPDRVNIKLNSNPEWNIDISSGASVINFDLSKFKVRSIKVKGGAAQYKIRLGQPLATTNLAFDTGVAEITIEIPQNAACHIQTDSQFSSNTFDGFNKKREGEYETSGYLAAKNKIFIQFKGGISDYKVSKY